jgi:hypothetical protein
LFIFLIESILTHILKRFELLDEHEKIYGFLYNSRKLKEVREEDLYEKCKNVYKVLKDDIDRYDLISEIKICRKILPENINILEMLRYLIKNNLTEIYPNFINVLKIVLTLPVTVAAAERSFSKLKIIKNYLRSKISQERFNWF